MEEQTLLKVEYIDSPCSTEEEFADFESACETEVIEFSVIGITDKEISKRKSVIQGNIDRIDGELSALEEKVAELNSEIDILTNYANGIDYAIAVSSGVLAGLIDSFYVGELSLENAESWGNDKIQKYVERVAKQKGYKGDTTQGAINYLEKHYPHIADDAKDALGGGIYHHLLDFSHHPTLTGLFFSLLTQFTGFVYGTDLTGKFIAVPVDKNSNLIGRNISEKITYGLINWIFHLISDIAGSTGTARKGNLGTGLAGPIVSLLQELSALPFFHSKDHTHFPDAVCKLFKNGVIPGSNIQLPGKKFDLRTELGLFNELKKQAVPVLINECLVRAFYFFRRLYLEMREKNVSTWNDLASMNWRNTLPFNNRTITRMLTISTSTFTACDLLDAVIRTGGVTPECILRINFVGVGRLAIAIGTDSVMGIKRAGLVRKRNETTGQLICLSNMKLYYKNADVACALAELHSSEAQMHHAEADLWIAVRDTETAFEEMCQQFSKVIAYYDWSMAQEDNTWNEIGNLTPHLKKTELFDYIMQL